MFLFWKKNKPDPYTIVQEKWKTSFGFLKKNRFALEKEATYESGIDKNRLSLSINKKNHFAWVLNQLYRYDNFYLEAEVEFDEDNPHSAVGFIFRYTNDENFYYFLISNKGFFRVDVVFNGNPMVRIDWTESPYIGNKTNSIRMIARDTYLTFCIDDEWIAELEDDTLISGRIGFAAQNYDEKPGALFYCNSFLIESRPIEVERHFERWSNYIPQEPEARIQLAKTFYAMGAFPAATIQMRKALRHKKPDSKDYFLLGELCVNMGMYDLALESIEKCLEIEPANKEAIQEKGNLLYLLNRFIDARDFLQEIISGFEDNATVWNLLGNCEYSIGNFEKSLKAYEKAISIQDDMPIFFVNAARAAQMNKDKEKAIQYYLKASGLFFHQEAYDELYPIFASLQKLDSVNDEVRALAGKILFIEEKTDNAEEIFNILIKNGCNDSSIYYLNGIIRRDRGEIDQAIKDLEKACSLEDTFYLYWLRLGEVKAMAGQNPEKELKKALDLAPENPWTLNQYGLYLLDKGDQEKAYDYFNRALERAPQEADIAINLSQSLFNLGKTGEAFKVLETEAFMENARIYNQRGNLYASREDYHRAVNEYKKALNLEPENPVYLENCAKACIDVDMIMDAEEYLTRLFDVSPTASVHNLIGYLALIKREWVRAGVAFKEGLEKDPDNSELMINLASLYLDRSDYKASKEWIDKVLVKEPGNEEALQVQNRIRIKFEKQLECATCSRRWWVPLDIPPQSLGTIHGEPPGDAPAGKCETCGKIYCITCAQEHLKDKRFICPDCGQFLKLSDDWLKYLLIERLKESDNNEKTGKETDKVEKT